jgi:hypothetical protein
MLRQETLASVCAMILMFGGCPKRQVHQSVVVYVPATPAAAAAKSEPAKPEVLVIEEPAPPPEPAPSPEKAASPQGQGNAGARHRRIGGKTTAPPEPEEETPPDNPETPPAEVPALEPRESRAEEAELQERYQKLAQDVRERMMRVNGSQLSANDRRTFEDARTFFAQSVNASRDGDLPRALALARKASLLLAALE